MARKRMIDPEIWTDEKILELSWDAVPFYIGLVSQADDEGRLRYSAASLKAKICPRDGITTSQVEAWMWECVAVGLVLIYEVDSAIFATLPGWPDYQKVQHPTPSRIPEPPSNLREESIRLHESSRTFTKTHEASPQVRLDRLNRIGEIGGAKTHQGRPQITESDLPRFDSLELDVVAYVDNARAKNKSGRLAIGKEFALRRELAGLLEALGRDSFAYGLREANRRNAPNANYVKACASSWQQKGSPRAADCGCGLGVAECARLHDSMSSTGKLPTLAEIESAGQVA